MSEERQDIAVKERVADEHRTALRWLGDEFPDWDFDVGTTSTPSRGDVPWWVARREGHHPQAALSPGKLHSRLSDYRDREERRDGDPEHN